ncbi:hypothetical protein BKA56DRAFT_39159 [Ilyonectria sp. MPI-CAGE-AT-0026]|nr:hypothetical protein BKA56DRAFT_39159 [Ilyonectria sp. MPI-CAGE-AT-0026]
MTRAASARKVANSSKANFSFKAFACWMYNRRRASRPPIAVPDPLYQPAYCLSARSVPAALAITPSQAQIRQQSCAPWGIYSLSVEPRGYPCLPGTWHPPIPRSPGSPGGRSIRGLTRLGPVEQWSC